MAKRIINKDTPTELKPKGPAFENPVMFTVPMTMTGNVVVTVEKQADADAMLDSALEGFDDMSPEECAQQLIAQGVEPTYDPTQLAPFEDVVEELEQKRVEHKNESWVADKAKRVEAERAEKGRHHLIDEDEEDVILDDDDE